MDRGKNGNLCNMAITYYFNDCIVEIIKIYILYQKIILCFFQKGIANAILMVYNAI